VRWYVARITVLGGGVSVFLSADDLVQFLTQVLYVAIFVLVAFQAARRPFRTNVDIALLFGAISLVISIQWYGAALRGEVPPVVGAIAGSLLMALPYLLLRLLDDFAGVPPLLVRGSEIGLILSVVVLLLIPPPLPVPLTLALVAYFVGLIAYVALAFIRQAGSSSGVTRSRMQAVALGSGFLGLTILTAGLLAVAPALSALWVLLARVGGLASGVCYFAGFAPPTGLRRAWQEPELRTFLRHAARLPRLPDTPAVLAELRAGVARSLGAPGASIGLWDASAGVLRFHDPGWSPPASAPAMPPGAAFNGKSLELQVGHMYAGRAFSEQRPLFTEDAARGDPANAAFYHAFDIKAVLAAPITAGEKRLGVLVVHGPRAPIFADSDLELVTLLADQAAVILESRALIDEASRMQAREEAARLKDDFLSSAAHDLRTPLTVLLAQAQLLERQAQRDGLPENYSTQIGRLVAAARHLSALVRELLDASRAERGKLVGPREPADLATIARDACESLCLERHRVVLDGHEPLLGSFDSVRIRQLLDNLIENAVKYSPAGGEVRVRVWPVDAEARLSVSDRGIGIPAEDLSSLFERYHRGRNVDDRRYSGLGLGLYICRAIVEQHGGRIWAESALERGTTIHVALPLAAVPRATEGAA
jgi:signal transduction histidine kinase